MGRSGPLPPVRDAVSPVDSSVPSEIMESNRRSYMCIELKKYLLQVQECVRHVAADVYPVSSHIGKVMEDAVARMTEIKTTMNKIANFEALKVAELSQVACQHITITYHELIACVQVSAERCHVCPKRAPTSKPYSASPTLLETSTRSKSSLHSIGTLRSY